MSDSDRFIFFFFFFSSRRRHTRLTCDWSSDVCSSDLRPSSSPQGPAPTWSSRSAKTMSAPAPAESCSASSVSNAWLGAAAVCVRQIGRASCRERGESSGGGGSFKKKKRQEGAGGGGSG